MPAIPAILFNLIQTKVAQKIEAISGHSPLAQANPAYFIKMCLALGKGIAEGTPTITFTTVDAGASGVPPLPGVGVGTGIVVDAAFMSEQIYTKVREYVIEDFGKTAHEVWPPSEGNSGHYLKAFTDGISEAVKEHYSTAWTLSSAHPIVYAGTGTVTEGSFSGIIPEAVKSKISEAAPDFTGPFWVRFAQAVAEGYVNGIHNKSTGTVVISGICIPGPSQVCGLPLGGSGTGVAA